MGPLSALRHSPRPPSQDGFTLIEVMVTVVVIGIVAALAVANLGGDSRSDLAREAKRLAGALEHAQALAQWQSETLGVSAEGHGYRFWRRDGTDHWIALTGDDVLAPRALPAGMSVAAQSFAGAPVPPDAIVGFRASGRNEPYVFLLGSAAGNIVVAGDPVGRVRFAFASSGTGPSAPAN